MDAIENNNNNINAIIADLEDKVARAIRCVRLEAAQLAAINAELDEGLDGVDMDVWVAEMRAAGARLEADARKLQALRRGLDNAILEGIETRGR